MTKNDRIMEHALIKIKEQGTSLKNIQEQLIEAVNMALKPVERLAKGNYIILTNKLIEIKGEIEQNFNKQNIERNTHEEIINKKMEDIHQVSSQVINNNNSKIKKLSKNNGALKISLVLLALITWYSLQLNFSSNQGNSEIHSEGKQDSILLHYLLHNKYNHQDLLKLREDFIYNDDVRQEIERDVINAHDSINRVNDIRN